MHSGVNPRAWAKVAAAANRHCLCTRWGRHLEVAVDDGRFLLVHVLHGAAGLVEDLEDRVARDGALLLHPLDEVHQLT